MPDPAARRRACGTGTEPVSNADIEEQQLLKARLYVLESEHRDLDDVIERLSDDKPFDQLQLQRLKKRKLVLKDELALVRSQILPDIIA